MKYLKRLWFSLVAIPVTVVTTSFLVLCSIWKGKADDEGWLFK